MDPDNLCVNGHPMADHDIFCGTCGAPAAADFAPTAPETEGAGESPTILCPDGHPNPAGNAFCASCGKSIGSDEVDEPVTKVVSWAGRRRQSLLVAGSLLVVGLGVLIWRLEAAPTEAERQEKRQEEIADFYTYEVPHGEDAWDVVADTCDLDSSVVMTDYVEVSRSDYDAYYLYETSTGDEEGIPVSLNGYGAITWIDTCYSIDGTFSHADRVDVDWGEP